MQGSATADPEGVRPCSERPDPLRARFRKGRAWPGRGRAAEAEVLDLMEALKRSLGPAPAAGRRREAKPKREAPRSSAAPRSAAQKLTGQNTAAQKVTTQKVTAQKFTSQKFTSQKFTSQKSPASRTTRRSA